MDKNTTDAMGRPGFVQSSPSGESVTYYSAAPFPGIAASSEFPQYLSSRTGTGWSLQGLTLPAEAGSESELYGLIEDNEETIAGVLPEFEERFLLAPGAELEHTNLYLHDNVTEEYRLIASRVGSVKYEDSTPDGSHILFTSTGHELVHDVVNENENPYLYEWDRETGKLSFVGYVNNEAPESGTIAGSNENNAERTYNQDTISADGLRIFVSEKGQAKKVYMREPEAGRTVEVSEGAAQWRAATPSGSFALYTEGPKGEELYRFNVADEAHEQIAAVGAKVLGTVGMANNGSYVYFVAEGVLASNDNGNKEKAMEDQANLYEWHEGSPTPIAFVATLNRKYDEGDWEGFVLDEPGGPDQGDIASRVSPSGTRVLISSKAKVTSYDNAEKYEIYLYDATKSLSVTNPRCVSCNLSEAKASHPAFLSINNLDSAPVPSNSFMTRNLSANGTRVFFQTAEALLPLATDGQENVYEWEQEGAGSCSVGTGIENGGCLYLISSGQSLGPSYFGDASENGEDVFFFTRQSLVSQDQDQNVDIYDAREEGGIASQSVASLGGECEGEEGCRGASTTTPALGLPSSATVSGTGNLVPPPVVVGPTPNAVRCKQGFTNKKDKCVKKHRRKKVRRPAHTNRRAGR